ncbi:CCA tRNA nucleotidyltransferase, partial [bacterium]
MFLNHFNSNNHEHLFTVLEMNQSCHYLGSFKLCFTWLNKEIKWQDSKDLIDKYIKNKDNFVFFVFTKIQSDIYVNIRSNNPSFKVSEIINFLSSFYEIKDKNIDFFIARNDDLQNVQKNIKRIFLFDYILNLPISKFFSNLLDSHTSNFEILDSRNVISLDEKKSAENNGIKFDPEFFSYEILNLKSDLILKDFLEFIPQYNMKLFSIKDFIITYEDFLEFFESIGFIRYLEYKRNFLDNYEFEKQIQKVLHFVSDLAFEENVKVFLVGGHVRDILLGYRELKDLDIAVLTGDGIDFACKLKDLESNIKLKTYEQFRTAKLLFDNGFEIDITTVRQETYKDQGSLPNVKRGNLVTDMKRRDFTVNAMAISLNRESYGKLIDYYGGFQDLKDGKLRILHNKSFIDDPTRLYRGFRFAARFNFEFEKKTELLIRHGIQEALYKKISSDRILEELKKCFKETAILKTIGILDKYDILKSIHQNIKFNENFMYQFYLTLVNL